MVGGGGGLGDGAVSLDLESRTPRAFEEKECFFRDSFVPKIDSFLGTRLLDCSVPWRPKEGKGYVALGFLWKTTP